MLRCVKKCCEVLKMNDYTVLIPELRSAMNVTQEDFAKLLGVTAVSVSRWENGKTAPTKIIKKCSIQSCRDVASLTKS